MTVVVFIFILSLLVSFLAGYIIGKRVGNKIGRQLGSAYSYLEIRMKSLIDGKCRICKTPLDCYNMFTMIK